MLAELGGLVPMCGPPGWIAAQAGEGAPVGSAYIRLYRRSSEQAHQSYDFHRHHDAATLRSRFNNRAKQQLV